MFGGRSEDNSKLKPNAFGRDGISNMIRHSLPRITKYLMYIFYQCLSKNKFSCAWKLAYVSPLAKINHPDSYKDLRHISLLSVLTKVLEKIMLYQTS